MRSLIIGAISLVIPWSFLMANDAIDEATVVPAIIIGDIPILGGTADPATALIGAPENTVYFKGEAGKVKMYQKTGPLDTDIDGGATVGAGAQLEGMTNDQIQWGKDFTFVKDDFVTSVVPTGNNDWHTKLTMTLTSMPIGSYKVEWYTNWNTDNASKPIKIRIEYDDGVSAYAIGNLVQEPDQAGGSFASTGSESKLSFAGFDILNLFGDSTIKIMFSSQDNNNIPTMSLWNSRLLLHRVGDWTP